MKVIPPLLNPPMKLVKYCLICSLNFPLMPDRLVCTECHRKRNHLPSMAIHCTVCGRGYNTLGSEICCACVTQQLLQPSKMSKSSLHFHLGPRVLSLTPSDLFPHVPRSPSWIAPLAWNLHQWSPISTWRDTFKRRLLSFVLGTGVGERVHDWWELFSAEPNETRATQFWLLGISLIQRLGCTPFQISWPVISSSAGTSSAVSSSHCLGSLSALDFGLNPRSYQLLHACVGSERSTYWH